MTQQLRMENKIALITGAAGGIGGATAELFCRHGAKVLLVDTDEKRLMECTAQIRQRVPGAAAQYHCADVTDSGQVEAAVAAAASAFGGLNVLVNNAAVRYLSPVENADVNEWRRLHAVNVLGAVNGAKAALPFLKKQGGAIVNVSSTYALVGRKDFGAYDATKAALVSLTQTLAHEGAAFGVRANAVCPGGTLTPFTIGRAKARGLDESDLIKEKKSDTLLKRWCTDIEVSYPILWLASDEASFVTGAILPVDGGTSIM